MEIQKRRNSLIEAIESELEKGPGDIDPELIDRRIDELYALDGRSPPKIGDEARYAAARAVRARAAWRSRNRLTKGAAKRRFMGRAVRGAVAACCGVFFFFSANYVTTWITGSCIPSKVGIKICCGTKYCLCDPAPAEAVVIEGGKIE